MNNLIEKLLNGIGYAIEKFNEGRFISIQERRAITTAILISDDLPADWIERMQEWNPQAKDSHFALIVGGKTPFCTQELQVILRMMKENAVRRQLS